MLNTDDPPIPTGPFTRRQAEVIVSTYAIEQLKSQGWVNAVVSDEEWDSDGLAEEYNDTDAMLVRKSALTCGYSDEGKLVTPVEFLVMGELSACMAVFQACSLPSAMMTSNRITLQPEQ